MTNNKLAFRTLVVYIFVFVFIGSGIFLSSVMSWLGAGTGLFDYVPMWSVRTALILLGMGLTTLT